MLKNIEFLESWLLLNSLIETQKIGIQSHKSMFLGSWCVTWTQNQKSVLNQLGVFDVIHQFLTVNKTSQ